MLPIGEGLVQHGHHALHEATTLAALAGYCVMRDTAWQGKVTSTQDTPYGYMHRLMNTLQLAARDEGQSHQEKARIAAPEHD